MTTNYGFRYLFGLRPIIADRSFWAHCVLGGVCSGAVIWYLYARDDGKSDRKNEGRKKGNKGGDSSSSSSPPLRMSDQIGPLARRAQEHLDEIFAQCHKVVTK